MSCASAKINEHGNALVLAVLILLALTSAGVVAVYRTNMDLTVAGNVVRAMQARVAGEAGTMHGLQIVGNKPAKLIDQLRFARQQAMETLGVDGSFRLTHRLFGRSTAIPDPAGAGATQHLPTVEGTNALARMRQDVAFEVSGIYNGSSKGWPGYDVDADICHDEFDFDARGGIPTAIEAVETTLPAEGPGGLPVCADTVIVETRARVVVGPVQCRQ